jgi:hypothetical protein
VNNNVNEEDLKCQQKAEHKYDSLFSDTIKVSPYYLLLFIVTRPRVSPELSCLYMKSVDL